MDAMFWHCEMKKIIIKGKTQWKKAHHQSKWGTQTFTQSKP
jgi:hypothetical protein